jgi:hypothetical protein
MEVSQHEALNINTLAPVTEKRKEVGRMIICGLLIAASFLCLLSGVLSPGVGDIQRIVFFILALVLMYQGSIGFLLIYLYKKDIINDSSDYSRVFEFLFIEIIVLPVCFVIIYIQVLSHIFIGTLSVLSHQEVPSDFYIKLTMTITVIINIILMSVQSFYSMRSLKNKRII